MVNAHLLPKDIPDYWGAVKPILDRRCVVCHSCYDAPCQLKLSAPEGIDRGATKVPVYDPLRLNASEPTRLFFDEHSTAEWRTKGFFPVLNEREQNPETNKNQSMLYRLLLLKKENPLPTGPRLPESVTIGLNREQECPRIEEMDRYEKAHPLWGMPYGLPAVSEDHFSTLTRWIEAGALISAPPPLSTKLQAQVERFERFLNGESLKEQLMSRYLYEHLFLGDLYFDGTLSSSTFKLVRSKTPAGIPIKIISTRRPLDDPETTRVYYRLQRQEESLVSKTHMPYRLNDQKIKRFKELFLDPSYTVSELPTYNSKAATNPFLTFAAIPPNSRYQFMLDDAAYFVQGFIKGPVCQGQTALNVINDRFWVLFVNPDSDPSLKDGAFLLEKSELMQLPSEEGSNASIFLRWSRYSDLHEKLVNEKKKHFAAHGGFKKLTLDFIWDGEKTNRNAALTVFRHFDSGSVAQGLVGEVPQTAWIMGYTLLERTHYLLVTGFDVFGNVAHQALTRLYMDFIRSEGENNFLALLPPNTRQKEVANWYRGISALTLGKEWSESEFSEEQPGINYTTPNPKEEFFHLIRARLGDALSHQFELPSPTIAGLQELSALKGRSVSILPDLSILRLTEFGKPDLVYSIVLNRAHLSVASLAFENLRLIPEEDDLTVVPGIIGAYPNSFFTVERSRLSEFATRVGRLKSEKDYNLLRDDFGVRRTDNRFWEYSDWLADEVAKHSVGGAEFLDYSRLEDR